MSLSAVQGKPSTIQPSSHERSVCVTAADAFWFAAVANMSIATLNLSLLVNTVGFYQVSGTAGVFV